MLLLTNDFVFGYEVPHSQPTITYTPCGGLEDDPSDGADMQEEEIDLPKNRPSSRSPSQRVHSVASPLIKITGNLIGAHPSQNKDENGNAEEDAPMDDRSDHNGDNEDGRGDGDGDNGRGNRGSDNGRDGGDDGQRQQGRVQTKQPTKLRGTAFKNTSSMQPKPPVNVTQSQLLTRKPAPTSNAASTSTTQGMLSLLANVCAATLMQIYTR
ncbi:hypothetical protein SCLCIDRAFT_9706 [Scleroderma citrinum Foug A]|uniref:Uncharacterized protein n=1 Tax=Scleroderma citrinum Foug A TaxID=1036808 RepID=A0A0C3A6I3_9AGAM|nr:hypothetical protein SCLCIDRAFT_9706 [Scleroderma citrinum Foug A]